MNATCVIVEDEPLALETLREMVEVVPWLDCLGCAADGESAVRLIDERRPDLVLLDIELPVLSGLEVLDRLAFEPAVIFTTAYDKYAVSAFELGAVDYLLKPFRQDRLDAALRRFADHRGTGARDRLKEVSGSGRLTRVFVRVRDRIVPVDLNSVERFEGEGDYVAMYGGGQRYLINITLNDLERRLDTSRFCRVHRSHIVNLDFVVTITQLSAARLELEMKDGSRIGASRSRSRELRQLVI